MVTPVASAQGSSIAIFDEGAGTYGPYPLLAGHYAIIWSCTLGGGNAQLNVLAADGNYVPVGSAISATGLTTLYLPAGQYEFVITTATANYLNLVRIAPE